MIQTRHVRLLQLLNDGFLPPNLTPYNSKEFNPEKNIEILDSLCRGYSQYFNFVVDYNNTMIKGYDILMLLENVFHYEEEYYLDLTHVEKNGAGYFNFTFGSIKITAEKTKLCIPIKSLISSRAVYNFNKSLQPHFDIDMISDFISHVGTTIQDTILNIHKLNCDDSEIKMIMQRCFK